MRRLWVMAVDNEVKEVLYELGAEPAVDPERLAVNLRRDGSQQDFASTAPARPAPCPATPRPSSTSTSPTRPFSKAGAFKSIGTAFELLKLHQHSHLYTSRRAAGRFSGPHFPHSGHGKSRWAALKAHLGPEARAHVTTRNFPDSVADFRRRTGIREGGDIYLFATTDLRGRLVVLVCEK